jgi:recombination protein RecR
VLQLEASGAYRGRYHVLAGKLSPMQGEGVEDLRVEQLQARIRKEAVREVILALDTDVESDATATFLHDLLGRQGVRVTRPAMGIPVGSGIAYADAVSLERAMHGRRDMD